VDSPLAPVGILDEFLGEVHRAKTEVHLCWVKVHKTPEEVRNWVHEEKMDLQQERFRKIQQVALLAAVGVRLDNHLEVVHFQGMDHTGPHLADHRWVQEDIYFHPRYTLNCGLKVVDIQVDHTKHNFVRREESIISSPTTLFSLT